MDTLYDELEKELEELPPPAIRRLTNKGHGRLFNKTMRNHLAAQSGDVVYDHQMNDESNVE